MSTHTIPAAAVGDEFMAMLAASLRMPRTPDAPAEDGTQTIVFDPDLTAEEQTRFDMMVELAASTVSVTPDEWAAMRPHIQTLRELRQLGRSGFMALTAAERDRLLYDALTAETQLWLALLRS